jgi:hypothetical protein
MKSLILLLATIALSAQLFAQNAATDILKDYQQKSEQALVRINQTLEKQGAELAAKLVASGDTNGADELSKQIKDKIAGTPVVNPHSAAVLLFRQYDAARVTALKPIQATSITKIEAVLKTSAGKKMETVLELGRIRRAIESGVQVSQSSFPEVWTYHMSENGAAVGDATFAPDGTFDLYDYKDQASQTGKWESTADPNVVKISYKNMEWKVVSNGEKAVIERPDVGLRYLRLKKNGKK